MSQKTRDEWTEIFLTSDVPFAPLLTPAEAMNSEHAKVNNVMADAPLNGRTVRVPTSPISIRTSDDTYSSRPPSEPYTSPPGIGEQTDEVLREFGLDELVGQL